MRKFAVILVTLMLTIPQFSKASHLLGGEITWECVKSNGKLIFTMKLYRRCDGAQLPTSGTITNPLYASNGGTASITVSRTERNDISPDCFADSAEMDCYINGRSTNAIEENIYVSSEVSVYGTPATGGSAFSYSICCRPPTSVMRNINGSNYWIRAVMFPFTDPATGNTLSLGSTSGGPTCYDSSPKFAEKPATIICTGYEFTYNHNATDAELDSLSYSWTPPMQNSSSSVTWKAGYSVINQLPTKYHNNNNEPAKLNALTGEIKFTAFSPQGGYHSTAVKVTAYKCRQKVAEIYRDIPVVLLACPPTPTIPPLANTPPQVNFKWSANSPVNIPLPAGDTVMAGDSVNFYITSIDIQFLPGFVGQTNFLLPSGSQFGERYADTAKGCLYPPCAILDTNNTFWNGADSAKWWQGEYGLQTRFSWKTDCNHLAQVTACFTKSNTYNFVFKVLDDWCPAPGMNFQTFSVTVLAPPALEPPKYTCSRVLSNGDVVLNWTQPVTRSEDTLNSFQKYVIMRAIDTAGAPFDTVHVVQDIDSLTWTDTTANTLNSFAKYYLLRGISSCNDQGDSILSDTISGMKLEATPYNSGNAVFLDWTDYDMGNRWGSKTTGEYYVNQIVGTDTTIVDTVTESWDSLEVALCYPTFAQYFITVVDTTAQFGCTSYSNIDGDSLGDNTAPGPVYIDSISFDQTNRLNIGWYAPTADVGWYYIHKDGILVDSIPGTVTNYEYNMGANDTCLMEFEISARDTCGNLGLKGLSQYSMCNNIVNASRCMLDQNIQIQWTRYNPSWSGGATYQEIWRSDNGGAYVLIDTVNALTSSYTDTSVYGGANFCYRIRSWEQGQNRESWTYNACYFLDQLIDSTIVDPPDLRCVSWENDSTIRLTWIQPPNPGLNFDAYMIYHSTIGEPGTFTLLDSIKGIFSSDNLAIDSTGYTHLNASDTVRHFYRVYSRSGCYATDLSPVGVTMEAPRLSITSISDSVNRLEWNEISPVQLHPTYEILRDGMKIADVNYGTQTFEDVYAVCNKQVQYQVRYEGNITVTPPGECWSETRLTDGEFVDDTPPAKQFVDSVSMYPDTFYVPRVGWSPNKSLDVTKYYVLNCEAGGLVLDTIDANTGLYWEDVNNAPVTLASRYSVVAEDSCGNNQLASGNFNCHSNLVINPVMDYCDQSIRVSWNGYETFASGNKVEYVVYASMNGAPYSEIGRTKETLFTHEDIVNENNYCYFVQAWENDGEGPFSASSAVVCLDAEFIIRPDYAYMQYVTVDQDNVIRLAMQVDLNSNTGEYWINRSTDKNEKFELIATLQVPDPIYPADSTFYYQDEEVETSVKSYYYKIDVVDKCGAVGITSNLGRSILLNVEPDQDRFSNVLTFNKYEEFYTGVQEYEVYRGVNGVNMELVKSIVVSRLDSTRDVTHTESHITYVDNVRDEGIEGDGKFCYLIAAIEATPTHRDKDRNVSKSNIDCGVQYPNFFAPTGFTPNGDGLNDVFRPQGSFHDADNYEMEVYNRWGEMLYKTDNYEAGWDGTYNGNESPVGAYVYIVRYTSADGNSYEERGTVTLTR